MYPFWGSTVLTSSAASLGASHPGFTFIPLNFRDPKSKITEESCQWTETGVSRGQFSPHRTSIACWNQHLIIYRGAQVKYAPSTSTSVKCLTLDGTNPPVSVFQRPSWPLEIITDFNGLWGQELTSSYFGNKKVKSSLKKKNGMYYIAKNFLLRLLSLSVYQSESLKYGRTYNTVFRILHSPP